MIRVVLVDDQVLLRATIKILLDATPGIDVVGEAGTGADALEQVRRHRPDVVLMDIRMPGMDGVEATGHITTDPELEQARVIVLTTFETDELVVAALRAGASGFISKGIEPAGLIEAITTVHAGESLLSPAATTALIARFLTAPVDEPTAPTAVDTHLLASLTEREREVLGAVAAGLSNRDIATALFISPATAKTHVSRAMNKLGAHDRAQLVVFAYEHGLVTPGHTSRWQSC